MKRIFTKDNLMLFIPLLILMIISFFCMYQSSFIKNIYRWHLAKQVLWFGVGFLILLIFQKIKIRKIFDYSFLFYILGNILLILVLFLGKDINGARAWFDLKIFNFQPSEFMKIGLLLYLIHLAELFSQQKISELKFLVSCLVATLIPSILVFLEPDTGAIIIYLLLLFSVLIFSKIHKFWFILFFTFLILFGGLFFYLYFYQQELLIKYIGTSFFYRVDRLLNFKDGSGLQLNNALTTIGNSNLFGHGIQKELLYVPEFPTDFVFTLAISIFGFGGAIIILLCYFILNRYFIKKIFSTNRFAYQLFINGFLFIFIFQQTQNILMNIGLVPIMGIPLPFLSYGGSNMIIYFLFLGIILNSIKKAT